MDQPRHVLDRCFELVRDNCFEEADSLTTAGLDRFPDDGKLWEFRGLIRHRMRDFRTAGEALETASLLVPLTPAASRALADCHMKAGETSLARDLYLHLSQDPKCPTDLLPAVASGLGGLEEYHAALETCCLLTQRDPSRHEAHFGIAYYLRRLGHPTDAIFLHVQRAYELSPLTPLYRITLASLLDQSGQKEEARELLRDLNPRSISCSCCLGRIAAIFRSFD